MLTPKEIMDAVQELLEERFPEEKVYRNLTPTGFSRPSWLIYLGPIAMLDASAGCLEVRASMKVTAFVTVDEYHNSHMDELQRRMMAVQELFAVEGLRVSDRVLHVVGNTGESQFDFAEVTVTLHYQDDRPGAEDWPLMGEIQVSVRDGGTPGLPSR